MLAALLESKETWYDCQIAPGCPKKLDIFSEIVGNQREIPYGS